MKKKILSFLLAGSLILSLAACGGGGAQSAASGSASSSGGGMEVDENLLTVDITMPASLFEGTDMTTFDPDAYAAEQGFKKAVVNEDGSIKVTMSKAKHKELVADMLKNIETSFNDMVKAEDSPYITAIDHTKDFDVVKISVDKTGYDAAGFVTAFIPLAIYMQVAFYQTLANVEARCEIQFVDAAAGTVIESVTYPDALNGAQ